MDRALTSGKPHDAPSTMSRFDFNKPLPDAFRYGGSSFLAKPLVELEMARLSAEIRRKPPWWAKFRDPDIIAKWRAEALAQEGQMREPHVDYVLKELDGYANLRDDETGAEVSCFDTIWQSDKLVPSLLRDRLLAGVANLEDVPEWKKVWHPRSNGQVLDLVHPSLYPIVYGRTPSYPEDYTNRDTAKLEVCLEPPATNSWIARAGKNAPYFLSKRFQWLPTDFKVSDDGKTVKSDGYINNLHPVRHAELHKTVEDLIAAYIPLFERVLTDCIPTSGATPRRTGWTHSYDEHGSAPSTADFSGLDEWYKQYKEWQDSRPIAPPEVLNNYELGSLERRQDKYTLSGKTIQVIVKLANIHLTPGRPTYSGGSWHIEGMKNESIAVSGIYYYDEGNITESRLAFRTAVEEPDEYRRDEEACMLTWGLRRDTPCVNELGSVITSQHRCIAFPNTYQHRVSPFELADKSRPGHRKILALFLVDPAVRRPSTKIVPPQQQDWYASEMASNPAFDKLPLEIVNRIASMAEGLMTREEAEAYRLELMDERAAFTVNSDKYRFMIPFAMDGGVL